MLKWIKQFLRVDQSLSSIEYREQGNKWLASGDLVTATQCYRQAIDAQPNYSDAYVNLGFALSEQKKYEEAILFLKKALSISPRNIDAIYMLGLIAQHQHKTDEAINYFFQAIDIDCTLEIAYQALWPLLIEKNQIEKLEKALSDAVIKNAQSAELSYFLGECCLLQNKFDKAIVGFDKSLSIQPDQPQAHCKLGNILQRQQKSEAAIRHYQQAIKLQPDYVNAYNNLGAALQLEHKHNEAIECLKKAIEISSDNPALYFNLGNVFKEIENYPEAAYFFQKAVDCNPRYSQAYHNLGIVFQEQGEFDSALKSYETALIINPASAEVEYCVGNLFHTSGNLAAAIEHYQKAIFLKSDYSDAYNNIGNIFRAQGKSRAAIEQYEKAISFGDGSADIYNNAGCAFEELNQLEKAIELYRKAISIKSDFGNAYNNLGGALKAQGRHDEAIECYQHALSIMPDNVFVQSNLLFARSADVNGDQEVYHRELQAYGDCVLRQSMTFRDWLTPLTGRENKPLRVGFVSGDFRKHPVGYFLENVISHVDTERLEVWAYSTCPKEDELTQKLKAHFASWVDISYLSDAQAAKKIRDDEIDVLIDLAGHTGHNRVALFGWKPAPIQVTWLGYWASTGVSTMDYVLVDEVSLPTSYQNQFTEKVWYLPETRMCFSAPTESATVNVLPAKNRGYITFGSFQNMSKISDDVLVLWGRVLSALPMAHLRLQNKQLSDASMQTSLKKRLEKAGIALERVKMAGSVSRQAYLEAHSEVDIILDTFPFTGGTTTCEALWMGVPTVTLAGNTMIARQGASMLTCAGLKDWVANTQEEYLNIAINKASDLKSLAQLRAGLREQVQASPLFDAVTFARNLENALRDMWREKTQVYINGQEKH